MRERDLKPIRRYNIGFDDFEFYSMPNDYIPLGQLLQERKDLKRLSDRLSQLVKDGYITDDIFTGEDNHVKQHIQDIEQELNNRGWDIDEHDRLVRDYDPMGTLSA